MAEIPERRERRHNHGTPYTDEEIIERIQLWAQLTGSPPSKGDWTPSQVRQRISKAILRTQGLKERVDLYESGDFPSESTVRDRFGSLNAALVRAGFEPRSVGRPSRNGTPDRPAPRIGAKYLKLYWSRVVELRAAATDQTQLRDALYDLGLAAIREADLMDLSASVDLDQAVLAFTKNKPLSAAQIASGVGSALPDASAAIKRLVADKQLIDNQDGRFARSGAHPL